MAARPLSEVARGIDERLGPAGFLKKALRKVFPDHWSFLLGEVAMYSFVIIVLTGIFLTLFFKPSMSDVVYKGSYVPLRGVRMSEAYESTLRISFDVRGGLLVRQLHHWGTIVFLSAIIAHMLRNFFTGAFRKPRELNWVIGVILFLLVMLNGLFGYSLPDDLLSGTGIRILEGVLLAIPIVGSYLTMFLFGGTFPGDAIIPRLFTIHVLLIPLILLALIPLHAVVLTWRQTHTQFPGKGRTDRVVEGKVFWPSFVIKTLAFQMWVFAVIAFLSVAFQVNPIWLFGPYNPGHISAGSQPDWYMGWLEGSLRLMPSWEINAFGHTIPMNVLIPALAIPGLLFTFLAVYPFLERWAIGDYQVHHLLDRPRDVPTRTGIGMAGVTFYGLLWSAGANDIIAKTFNIPLFGTTWFFRIAVIVGPILAFMISRRIALGLQRRERETLEHGVETGRIIRRPSGEYEEADRPLDADEEAVLRGRRLPHRLPELRPDSAGVEPKEARRPTARLRRRLNRLYADDVVPLPNGEHRERPAIEPKKPAH
ncbi:cytochrome bc1 complex cytochrome b subunit [Actinoallomurus iriomotensis]|uniref:Cytochrome bc1 complex cytochrome b subunit n=1 Tax=Actinoallomurus iriomotensis TaxID=478107 RepID=A0A9W6W0K4_9ACTN|nr:cytochrome bc complex cytochrome b subunit [Actinoallomurus iriomotensis]GLY86454.1 menaquinol-cytochrome c reductase cytochrome b subunit [Actinoallomurus iriomotensis]